MSAIGRKEIVKELRARVGIPKYEAEQILEAILKEITIEVVEKGNSVSLMNFGSFAMHEKKAREGRNPKTKEIYPIPARSKFCFSAATNLKVSIKEAK